MNDTHFVCRDCGHVYDTDKRGLGEINICMYCSDEDYL